MDVRELSSPPSLGRLYARAAASIVTPGGGGDGLPDREFLLRGVEVDRDHLAAYDRVCGFRLRDDLPATYPHLLAFPLSIQLMVEPAFPFPLVGLVHVANAITQERPLHVDEPIDLRVSARDLRPHPKGRQFDVLATAATDGEVVWTGRSTYLRRGRTEGDGDDHGDGDDRGRRDADGATGADEPAPDAVWHVPADTGRRYAAVSGDRNPIHLNPLTARLFGFPRQIAHGMWTKARCLAAFEGRLPAALHVDVAFKRPVILPTDVAFRARPADGGWRFSLRDPDRGAPHLEGSLHAR